MSAFKNPLQKGPQLLLDLLSIGYLGVFNALNLVAPPIFWYVRWSLKKSIKSDSDSSPILEVSDFLIPIHGHLHVHLKLRSRAYLDLFNVLNPIVASILPYLYRSF